MAWQGVPTPDYTAIAEYATRLAWLQATETRYTWVADASTGEPVGVADPDNDAGVFHVGLLISEQEFAIYKADIGNRLAPIWPGAAHVLELAPVIVTSATIIEARMHGVRLTIDEVDPGTGHQVAGPLNNYKYTGWLTFLNDLGDADELQFLNYGAVVYLPKRMKEASAVVIWLLRALQVTVTPWTLLP